MSKKFARLCSVCGNSQYDYLYSPKRSQGPVVKCKKCGFVYVNPLETTKSIILNDAADIGNDSNLLTSSNLDDIIDRFDETMNSRIQKYLDEVHAKQSNARSALKYIMDVKPIPGTILDYGCFCGVFLNEAKSLGWDSFGLEAMAAPAIYARAHYGLNVTTGTLRNAPYADDFFDVVTAFQVFEHLLHPDQELDMIYRIVKPGGLLLIEVPNINNILVKLLRRRHRHFVLDHISFFSIRTLSILLKRKGFNLRRAFFPTRTLSVRHIVWWLERYRPKQAFLERILPDFLLDSKVRINLKDIITVIAEKAT